MTISNGQKARGEAEPGNGWGGDECGGGDDAPNRRRMVAEGDDKLNDSFSSSEGASNDDAFKAQRLGLTQALSH
ncbi:hypothetical protein V6N12_063790 [Hibiscus sabdariffa]